MELPHVGKHCAVLTCKQLDFLPTDCSYCSVTFCQDHYHVKSDIHPNGHECSKISKVIDRKAITCPVCSQVVPIPSGQDPNVWVNRHIQKGCPKEQGSTTGQAFSNGCSFKNCTKRELVPITCNQCEQQFCIKHRLEMDHKCPGKPEKSFTKTALAAFSRATSSPAKTSSSQSRPSRGSKKDNEACCVC